MKKIGFLFLIIGIGFFVNIKAYGQAVDAMEVEFFELEWPADGLLCDRYEESQGELHYRVYRLKATKKIIYVFERGAYCQGDSEYGYYYLFNKEGNAVYSMEGGNIYVPMVIKIYESGKPVFEITYPPETEPATDPVVEKIKSGEVVTTQEFEAKIDQYKQQIQDRIHALKTLRFKNDETGYKEEADSLVKSLEAILQQKIIYKDGFVFRKPMPLEKGKSGEDALIRGTDIRVRAEPNTQARIITKISGYDLDMEVIDIEGMETIKPYGSHPWYKIKVTDILTSKQIEGWIFGAFIQEGIFPEKKP